MSALDPSLQNLDRASFSDTVNMRRLGRFEFGLSLQRIVLVAPGGCNLCVVLCIQARI